MKKIYYHNDITYWLDTYDYNYNKLKIGDEVICINSSIIGLASMCGFGTISKILDIDRGGINVNSWNSNKYKNGYTETTNNVTRIYKGTIKYEQIHKYGENQLIQTHDEWLQRFILLSDWIIFIRKDKLERVMK